MFLGKREKQGREEEHEIATKKHREERDLQQS